MDRTAAKSGVDQGQVSMEAARVYEEFFVPALFAEWAPRLAQATQVKPGDHVLDVACGTGVLTRYLARQVQPNGHVTGLDLNAGMLAVARGLAPDIQWDQGQAEALPYADNSFDAVASQFGLMFFRDRSQALKEMMRVLKPGQHLAVAVWDQLEHSPGYAALAQLLEAQLGAAVARQLRAPFVLGQPEVLRSCFQQAGIPGPQLTTIPGQARFPSLQSWIYTEVRGWVFSDQISDEQLEKLIRVAEKELSHFTDPGGQVQFTLSAHLVTASKEKYLKKE